MVSVPPLLCVAVIPARSPVAPALDSGSAGADKQTGGIRLAKNAGMQLRCNQLGRGENAETDEDADEHRYAFDGGPVGHLPALNVAVIICPVADTTAPPVCAPTAFGAKISSSI